MLRTCAFVAAALPLCFGNSTSPAAVPAPRAMPSIWHLTWDDSCDEVLDRADKTCKVALRMTAGDITGTFDGPVLGEPRNARFTGEELGGGALLTLAQREPDYTCVYQLSRRDDGTLVGTWRDTLGRSGTAVFRQAEPAPRRTY